VSVTYYRPLSPRSWNITYSNFDNSVQRVKLWTVDRSLPGNASPGTAISPSSSTAHIVGLGLSMSAITIPGIASEGSALSTGVPHLTTGQRKRIKSYLKRCRMNPRHSQLNLEGYLLLPVQRIPRYRLLVRFIHFTFTP
jgi:RhoGEF domain